MDKAQSDFDRIAQLDGDGWNHNNHYHRFLLRNIPRPCEEALEIGCGTGEFARLLSTRAEHLLALDLSPEMIRIARERSARYANISFQVADVLESEFPAERFDCVVSIATLHHLPMETMLTKMRTALRPGGTLIILDIWRSERISNALTSLLAVPTNVAIKLARNGRLRESHEFREAWAEHCRHDSYLTLSEVRRACTDILPGAHVRKHLFWRYSITWTKGKE